MTLIAKYRTGNRCNGRMRIYFCSILKLIPVFKRWLSNMLKVLIFSVNSAHEFHGQATRDAIQRKRHAQIHGSKRLRRMKSKLKSIYIYLALRFSCKPSRALYVSKSNVGRCDASALIKRNNLNSTILPDSNKWICFAEVKINKGPLPAIIECLGEKLFTSQQDHSSTVPLYNKVIYVITHGSDISVHVCATRPDNFVYSPIQP